MTDAPKILFGQRPTISKTITATVAGQTYEQTYTIRQIGPFTFDREVLRPLIAAVGEDAISVIANAVGLKVFEARKGTEREGSKDPETIEETLAVMQAVASLTDEDALSIFDMGLSDLAESFGPLFRKVASKEMDRAVVGLLVRNVWIDGKLITATHQLDDSIPDTLSFYRLLFSALWFNLRPTTAAQATEQSSAAQAHGGSGRTGSALQAARARRSGE